MTHHLTHLSNPSTDGLDAREREYLAYELTVIGKAARERSYTLRASGKRSVELAVVELDEFATAVLQRAHRYQYGEGSQHS
ncbi:hypothetical protein [Amycolatopsis sp. NPDC051903]|uniref:hypothetical protein n=1 Tax=Amycolatopsis sp. NPDC051903 TaxID=3363936 RepID=UPI0037BC5BE7